MYLSDLLERIQEEQIMHGEGWDPQVSIAVQPSYPMKCSLKGCLVTSDLAPDEDEPEDAVVNPEQEEDVFWLVAGDREDYTAESQMWDIAR